MARLFKRQKALEPISPLSGNKRQERCKQLWQGNTFYTYFPWNTPDSPSDFKLQQNLLVSVYSLEEFSKKPQNNYIPWHETQTHRIYNLTTSFASNICTLTKVRPQSRICFCASTTNPNSPNTHFSLGTQSTLNLKGFRKLGEIPLLSLLAASRHVTFLFIQHLISMYFLLRFVPFSFNMSAPWPKTSVITSSNHLTSLLESWQVLLDPQRIVWPKSGWKYSQTSESWDKVEGPVFSATVLLLFSL